MMSTREYQFLYGAYTLRQYHAFLKVRDEILQKLLGGGGNKK